MTEQTPDQMQQPAAQPVETAAQPAAQPVAQPAAQPVQAAQPAAQPVAQPVAQAPVVTDSGSFGWAVLGFFFPLVGLILFLVWKQTKPKSAKVAGIGAIVGFVLGIVMSIVSSIFLASMASYYYYY